MTICTCDPDFPCECNPTRMVKRDCGRHYGPETGPCRKCAYEGELRRTHPKAFQAGGTPYIALLGEVIP